MRSCLPALAAGCGLLLVAAPGARAATVWSGLDLTFSKPEFGDPTLPENQDRITDAVVLTRADTEGLYNVAREDAYDRGTFLRPSDTEWAFPGNNPGADLRAASFAALAFDPWFFAHGGNPASTVGQDAVLHLISEDIYLDIRFTVWGGPGGSFAYLRAVPVPEPSSAALMLAALVGYSAAARGRSRACPRPRPAGRSAAPASSPSPSRRPTTSAASPPATARARPSSSAP